MTQRSGGSRSATGLRALLVLLFFWDSASSQAADDEGQTVVVNRSTPFVLQVTGLSPWGRLAVLAAYRRLKDPACTQVFLDFRDSSGRPLQARLDELGQTGQSYLGWIRFDHGWELGACRFPGVFAMTTPGSRVVRFCERFGQAVQSSPGALANLVIHEELHSLGLGENPPSSQEITRRVASRCGS